jgi:hypothetical protein
MATDVMAICVPAENYPKKLVMSTRSSPPSERTRGSSRASSPVVVSAMGAPRAHVLP